MAEEKKTKASPNSITSGQWWIDFFNFKVMLIGEFTKFIYAIGVIAIIYNGINMMRFSVGIGIGMILGGVIGLHMLLELVMVLFSILDILRDIRNRLPVPGQSSEKQNP